MHKDVNTTYAPTKMFTSANELSFAIARLMDAQKVLTEETLDNETLTPNLQETWFKVRDSMSKETAQNLAVCIINNTPLSKTEEEINSIERLFYTTMYDFTTNQELSKALTDIFFSNEPSQRKSNFQFKGR